MKVNRTLDSRHFEIGTVVIVMRYLAIVFMLLTVARATEAAIVPTGDVEPGGTWTNSTVGYVGRTSDGSLLVDGGSSLQSGSVWIGYENGGAGAVTITGAGTTWTNKYGLEVGFMGTGTLHIDAGAQLNSASASLGYYPGATGMVTITGVGSKWTNNGELYIGYPYGSGTLTVADGGEVLTQVLYASLGDLYGNGVITVTRSAILDADLRFDAAHPTQAIVGFDKGGTLAVNAGGEIFGAGYKGNGSVTIAEGVTITSSSGCLGYVSGSSGTAIINGVGSKWTTGNLYVGEAGSGTLRIEAGGQVSSTTGYLGYVSYGNPSGTVVVTGPGSKWTIGSDLYVGYGGTGTLTVTDGGQVTAQTLFASLANISGNGSISATKGAVLDADFRFDATHQTQATIAFGSNGNLTVTAAGGTLGAGYKGTGSLTIAEGAAIVAPYGYLGYYASASGTAVVTGAASKWTNQSGLYIGNNGYGGLRIEAGGQVVSAPSYIGKNAGSSGAATITDANSKWTTGDLYVGNSGLGTLRIEAGGQVGGSYGTLGCYTGSSGTATITGTGSKWTNSGSIFIGKDGAGTLSIQAAGQVSNSGDGYLGYYTGSSGAATVTGTGSMWTNSNLYVGRYGKGTLSVEAGALVTSSSGYLGSDLSRSSGNVTITGAGSTWANGGNLYVGHNGPGHIRIEAGAQVKNSIGYLGYGTNSSGTSTVTGAGSKWTNSNDLYIGNSGKGTLRIEAGGQVTNSQGQIGYFSGSTGTVTVSGPGSTWTNASNCYVGSSGSGMLRVEDGGKVSNSNAYLGSETASSGTAIVTGAGSRWTNSCLFVGYGGTGSLRIEAGAQVTDSNDSYLGFNAGSMGTATVTGSGSKWTNTLNLYVGYNGRGSLTVADGGEVTALMLYASRDDLSGNGTITAMRGAVLDADLRFDASHPAMTTVAFGSGGTLTVNVGGANLGVGYLRGGSLTVTEGVTIVNPFGYLGLNAGSSGTATVTGAGSKWTNSNYLYVGNNGTGAMRIEAGGQVYDIDGYLGTNSGSNGSAVVTGTGSKWTSGRNLNVGFNGNGALHIEAGGQVSDLSGYLGYGVGSSGVVVVTGADSKWTNGTNLMVGSNGTGALHIRDGGMVTASNFSVNNKSILTIDVGSGSSLRVGNGSGYVTNAGKFRFVTGPQPAAGSQYSPINGGIWSGSGTHEALGGTWNATTHVFTVSPTLMVISGMPVTVDLTQQQRVLTQETAKNWTVGASLLAKTGAGNNFDFTATAMVGTDLTALSGFLEPGHSVLSSWNLLASGSGYNANDPIYLSLGIPASLNHGNVKLWRQTAGNWSPFTADDLTAADGYASFTITGVNTYAVTGLAPSAAWNMDADGSWQTGSNWTTAPNAPSGINVAAILGSAITAPRTITLAAPLTLGVLTFNSPQHYTLTGSDSLNLQVNSGYSAKLAVQDSDTQGHVIETPITLLSPLDITIAPATSLTLAGQVQNPTGQTLTISGGGTLTVTQGIETTGILNVQAGTLITPSLNAGTLSIGQSASIAVSVPEPSALVLLIVGLVGGCIMMHKNEQLVS